MPRPATRELEMRAFVPTNRKNRALLRLQCSELAKLCDEVELELGLVVSRLAQTLRARYTNHDKIRQVKSCKQINSRRRKGTSTRQLNEYSHLQDLVLHAQPPRAPVRIDADGAPGESREEERNRDEPRRRREAGLRGSHGGSPQWWWDGTIREGLAGWAGGANRGEVVGSLDQVHFRQVRSSQA